ncbi:glycosyltransferase [Isoptericola sp. NPDC057391]|uniref:glycosyltransferase n=1 Tax=Isoptericola sp. NPDC057391 TaxID=3346117 RepID=UPI0036292E8F
MANGTVNRPRGARSHVDGLVWIDGVLYVRTSTLRLDDAGAELATPRADAPQGGHDDGQDDGQDDGPDEGAVRVLIRAPGGATDGELELPARSRVEVVPAADDPHVTVRVRTEARFDPRTVAPDAGDADWVVHAVPDGDDEAHPVEVPADLPARAAIVGTTSYVARRGEDGGLVVRSGARADALVAAARPRAGGAEVRTTRDAGGRTVRLTVPLDGIRVSPAQGHRVVARGTAELVAPAGATGEAGRRPARHDRERPDGAGTFRITADGEDVRLEVTVPAAPGRWQVALTHGGVPRAVPVRVQVGRFRPARLDVTSAAQHAPDARPLVSVVVPVHDAAATVEDALRSAFEQTLSPEQVEIVAVDDGSSDDSLAILRRLAKQHPRMQVLTQPASGTAAAPRNAGIDVATGEYLFFLDADDLLTPAALEKLTDAAEQLEADVVLGKMEGFAGRTNVPQRVFRTTTVDADMVEDVMMSALGPTKLFRTSHVKSQGLRFPAGLRHGEDQAFVVEAELTARRMVVLADAVYYRVRGHEKRPGTPIAAQIEIRLLKTRVVAGAIERHTEPGDRRDALLPRPFGDRALEGVFRRPYLALDDAARAELLDRVADEFGHLWTPGLRARVHEHARPLYDLVFRRDAANVTALVRHSGGNVRLLPVVPGPDGFRLDAPASVVDALGHEALLVRPPRVEHRLVRLTTSAGRVLARGRIAPPGQVPLPDAVHAEWRRRGPARGGGKSVAADATVLRTVREAPGRKAVVFAVEADLAAIPEEGLWDLWVAPVWEGWQGPAFRLGTQRDASVDPDAVLLDGTRTVLHTNPRTGGVSVDRDGAHHDVPDVRLTALRTDPDGRPEAVLRVPSVAASTRVYAYVDAAESRDARHRLPWSPVDDAHLAVRLPVPTTTTAAPLTLAVASDGLRVPVGGDAPEPVATPEVRVEAAPGGPTGSAAAVRITVTRTAPPADPGTARLPAPPAAAGTGPVRLWWWRWRHPTELNFGDEVTAPVIERLTGRRVVWTALPQAEIVGAGSVLQLALRKRAANMPTVWGAGMIRPFTGEAPADFVPRAVRGRLSLESLSPAARRAAVLGDPGILADLLVDGPVTKRHALGIIPHYKDADDPTMRTIAALPGVRRIDVAWTPEEVAREIAACETVISSSMHGLIFADALAVPNAQLKVSDKLVGGDYKFRDYCSAFGPDRYQVPLTPTDVTGLDTDALADLVRARFRPPAGIDELRRGLVAALTV